MQDRRDTDKIILDRLESIQTDITKTKIDLALNTQATQGVEKHLATLNGKVASHNATIQEMQAKETVAALSLAELKADRLKEQDIQEKKNDKRSDNWSKAWWVIIGVGLSILGNIMNYVIRTDVLKEIFTK